MQNKGQGVFHAAAAGSLVLLIVWLLAWEIWVAPLKPGGSLLALKVLPLLIPLRGVIKRDVYTMQWSSMMILLFFTEGVVRGYSDTEAVSRWMAWGETALVSIYFLSSLLFLRPYKREAKRMAKELIDKLNAPR